MKFYHYRFISYIGLCSLIITSASCETSAQEEVAADKRGEVVDKNKLTSVNGFTATYTVENPDAEESEITLIIKKGDKVLSKIKGAKPIAFSPVDDILIVREATMDDDTQHYLLNIGKGEYSKIGKKRSEYVFGGRWTSKVSWSDDGQQVIVAHVKDMIAEGEDEVEKLPLKSLLIPLRKTN